MIVKKNRYLIFHQAIIAILIIGIFIDSLPSKISLPIYLILILTLIISSKKIITRISAYGSSLELVFMFFFLVTLILSANISCCFPDTLRRILRMSMAIVIYLIFSSFNWRKTFPLALSIYSILNIAALLLSIIEILDNNLLVSFWSILLLPNGVDYQIFEISRGRIPALGPIYMTFIIPISYMLSEGKKMWLAGLSLFSGLLTILLWNYRGHLVTTAIILFIIYFYSKRFGLPGLEYKVNRTLMFSLSIIILSLTVYFLISLKFINYPLHDRFLLKNNVDAYYLSNRLDFLKRATALFKTNLLFGAGPGSFAYYSPPLSINLPLSNDKVVSKKHLVFNAEPHNIFLEFMAETGTIGTISFGLILTIFAINDLRGLKSRNSFQRSIFAIASWSFIISAQFNAYSKSALYSFFIIRGMVSSFDSEIQMKKLKLIESTTSQIILQSAKG